MLDSQHSGKAFFLWLSTVTSEYRHLKQYEESATVHQYPISNSATTSEYRHLKQHEESACLSIPHQQFCCELHWDVKAGRSDGDTGHARMVIYNSFTHHATQKAVVHKDKWLLELWHGHHCAQRQPLKVTSDCQNQATNFTLVLQQFHSSPCPLPGSSTLKSTQLWTKGMKDVWPHYTITVPTQWAAHWQNTQQEHRPQLWCCSWKLGLPPAGI